MPKAYNEKLVYPGENSFLIRYTEKDAFTYPWHFHAEFELVLICNGAGKRYIGSSLQNFKANDMVFIGPNLPHCYINNNKKYSQKIKYYVLQIPVNYFGLDFLNTPELIQLKRLFHLSEQGVTFRPKTSNTIKPLLKKLLKAKGFMRILLLLNILDLLSRSILKTLSIQSYQSIVQFPTDHLLSKLCNYTTANFKKKLTIEKAASLLCMGNATFCRYFKKNTGKTYIEFVNEIRIAYACNLLINSSKTINEISLESGFNNISNFNRQFKKNKKITPLRFKNSYSLIR